MAYAFPPDIEELVNRLMTSEMYSTQDDVLRAALKLLRSRQATLESIAAGYADMQAGRCSPIEDVFAEIEAKFGWQDEP